MLQSWRLVTMADFSNRDDWRLGSRCVVATVDVLPWSRAANHRVCRFRRVSRCLVDRFIGLSREKG
jgi:hypothetical protein